MGHLHTPVMSICLETADTWMPKQGCVHWSLLLTVWKGYKAHVSFGLGYEWSRNTVWWCRCEKGVANMLCRCYSKYYLANLHVSASPR
jgi:hypothetical protein